MRSTMALSTRDWRVSRLTILRLMRCASSPASIAATASPSGRAQARKTASKGIVSP